MRELSYLIGLTVTAVIILTNVSYTMKLGVGDTLTIPNAYLFAALTISMDLVMVLCPLLIKGADRSRTYAIILVFAICSAFSIHATHGYLTTNTQHLKTNTVVNSTIEEELQLRLQDLKASRRRNYDALSDLRDRLKPSPSLPIQGFELYLSVALWLLHSLVWFALLTPTQERNIPNATGTNPRGHNGTSTAKPSRQSGVGRRPLV